ncbi:head GIN domain-containing protein [Salinimicrobium marinum]|uniref:head GIN domain-containing protein n=1 Tax=Salinimicrobium marinum TaxID=680283 RepID=UPI001676543C|nr:head GIN domain-containing protein [Salinimicrobium marinum]
MKKILYIFLTLSVITACNKEDAPDCFQTAGDMVLQEIPVSEFEELIVHGRIKLFIKQGEDHKVTIESGENLINEVSAEVENGRLSLRNENDCNLFRDYELTTAYVTVPNLTWLQNAGNRTIESVGELNFPGIWLRSFNQEKDSEIYTNGDFRMNLISDNIRITTDGYSNFFLSGEVGYFDVYIADDDSRVEAAELVAQTVEIQHRGTNKIIVNPQQVLKGEIRSTGDVISVNRPVTVDVETFYTGNLIFQNP